MKRIIEFLIRHFCRGWHLHKDPVRKIKVAVWPAILDDRTAEFVKPDEIETQQGRDIAE